MQLVADDLLCPTCQGYVHPFLERCPACGTERSSRFDEAAVAGPIGAAALLEDEATQQSVHFVVLRYTLKSNTAWSVSEFEKAFSVVAGSLTYGATVASDGPTAPGPDKPATLDGASLVLADGSLTVRAGKSGRAIVEIPLEAVLAATPLVKGVPAAEAWAGAVLGGQRLLPRRPLPAGDLLVTFSSGGRTGQLALANRRGLLAQTARPDHYVTLARWIGFLAAAAAENRWLSTGAAGYAAELGLGEPGVPAPMPGVSMSAPGTETSAGHGEVARSGGDGSPPAGGAPAPVTGVRAALEELEGLRAAGLVTVEEYEAKRREILARL